MIGDIRVQQFIMTQHWWTLALRGLSALLFGILAFAWPGITLYVLIILFGAFVSIDGLFTLIAALRHQAGHRHRGVLALQGIISIELGIIALFWPGFTVDVLVLVIALWALATGIFEIVIAIRLLAGAKGRGLLVLSGLLSIALSVLLASNFDAGALALVWFIAAYAILVGIMFLSIGFMLRRSQQQA